MEWAIAKVEHERISPRRNKFSYPACYIKLDLDNLDLIDSQGIGFSLDKFNYISLYQSDYDTWGHESIKDKITKRCQSEDANYIPGKIWLLTMPKVLGYIFIPVSFYLCYDRNNELRFMSVEINNTFFERHVYLLDVNNAVSKGKFLHWNIGKDFHVSPFFSLDYNYQISLLNDKDSTVIAFTMFRSNSVVFTANSTFNYLPGEKCAWYQKYFYFPFLMISAMPLITWQAFKLFIFRRLPVYKKPNPQSANTIRTSIYSWFDQLCYKLVYNKLKRLTGGSISVTFPDHRKEVFGDLTHQPIEIKLNNFELFRKLVLKGSIGFGESYMSGDWDSKDLASLLTLFLNNHKNLAEEKLNWFKPIRYLENIKHWLRKNTITNSTKNIREHYDLSNDFFKLFLDENMLYSSAYFKNKEDSLESAQLQKLELLANKSKLQSGHKVLEIGSGWGAMATHLAINYGCEVTSITLSKEQYNEANRRAESLGLKNSVKFEIKDYRHISDKYDRIVSIEMLEAVGYENLDSYFAQCNRALNPDGILAVQVIAYPDTDYSDYIGRSDWINRHIFPGSHLPSLGALLSSASKNGFVIDHVENLAEHYAETLKQWLSRFDQNLLAIQKMGYSREFIRKWRFYLSVCEAEFASRWLSVYQIVFTRPNNVSMNVKAGQQLDSKFVDIGQFGR